jgi:glucose/arabinose dehydrogenase
LIFDVQSGRLYETEHGPRGGDELNIIVAGRNYGWPVITYGMDYSGAYVSPYTQRPGLEQPVIYWTPSIAPSGLAMYRGDKFPAWRGDLFVGALAFKHLRRIHLDERGNVVDQEQLLNDLHWRIRDVRARRTATFMSARTKPTDACCGSSRRADRAAKVKSGPICWWRNCTCGPA